MKSAGQVAKILNLTRRAVSWYGAKLKVAKVGRYYVFTDKDVQKIKEMRRKK